MSEISAIVITRNERNNIGPCLEALTWADEIVIMDALSTDGTMDIARQLTPSVFQRPFDSFPRQRNAALDLAKGPWILFIDADERVPPALASEIRSVASDPDKGYSGYWVPRQNIILGKWVRHAGWWPDHQLRLFRKENGRYDADQEVHELVLLEGPAAYLENPILHHNYERWGDLFLRQNIYAEYEASSLSVKGVRPKPHNLILQPWREFRRRYFQWEGYKDGALGLLLCMVMAWYNFLVYYKLFRITYGRSLRSDR